MRKYTNLMLVDLPYVEAPEFSVIKIVGDTEEQTEVDIVLIPYNGTDYTSDREAKLEIAKIVYHALTRANSQIEGN